MDTQAISPLWAMRVRDKIIRSVLSSLERAQKIAVAWVGQCLVLRIEVSLWRRRI